MAAVVYACEPFRRAAFPITATISRSAYVSDALNIFEKLRRLVGSELLDRLNAMFDDALRDEIHGALNTKDLMRDFPMLAEKFWARMALPLVELNYKVCTFDKLTLKMFREIEEELAKTVVKALKKHEHVDDLVYALSILTDRDLWILDKMSELSFENFIKKLFDRDPNAVLQFTGYTMYLTLAWVSASAATFGIVENYREDNRDTLTSWCRQYAKEVEGYLDTLNILLDDEVYRDLMELGVLKR